MPETCKTTPPPGQDINVYLALLRNIMTQLNNTKDKESAIKSIDAMITTIRAAIAK